MGRACEQVRRAAGRSLPRWRRRAGQPAHPKAPAIQPAPAPGRGLERSRQASRRNQETARDRDATAVVRGGAVAHRSFGCYGSARPEDATLMLQSVEKCITPGMDIVLLE